jgi:hypothetical protein
VYANGHERFDPSSLTQERSHRRDRAARKAKQQVVAGKVLAENDFVASCKDGNNYRIYLNKAGRVIVEKQSPASAIIGGSW